MFISALNMFKIGIGPSASHTVGPMIAASRYLDVLRKNNVKSIENFQVSLHGSLALTGIGHGTDKAIKLGLLGQKPETYEKENGEKLLDNLYKNYTLHADNLPPIKFNPVKQLIFDYDNILPGHTNGMKFSSIINNSLKIEEIYYSVGGGFILNEEEINSNISITNDNSHGKILYKYSNAEQLLSITEKKSIKISDIQKTNELLYNPNVKLYESLNNIWEVMENSIIRGINTQGMLPGELNTNRRAYRLNQILLKSNKPICSIEWLGLYAMAVSEENAAGNKIVSAPTNGAAGIIPAIGYYYLNNIKEGGLKIKQKREKIHEYLLTASTIGNLLKINASISGAELGCQAETGGASAMAAAGLTAIMGGSPRQIENAAEIALEHHLGLTCDPVGGYVQIPCIERNSVGSVKALYASQLALSGDGIHIVSLDTCIETMRQTGIDMSKKYKETSLGGLAKNVKIPLNIPLCK